MTNLKELFIQKINEVYKNVAGYETYGSVTEFYDEDGVVIMKAEQHPNGIISFMFSDDGEVYDYHQIDDIDDNENYSDINEAYDANLEDLESFSEDFDDNIPDEF